MSGAAAESKDTTCLINPQEPDRRLHFRYGRGSVYEHETAITRTLEVLSPESELLCHDQRMFQVMHLNTELAWYNIHFELRQVVRLFEQGNLPEAQHLLERTVLLSQIPLAALETLITSMSQISLLNFRARLPANATGVDSPGMINLRYITRVMWAAFEEALDKLGHTPGSLALLRIQEPVLPDTLRWAAKIFDTIQQLDIKLMGWRQLHLRLVWTHLGGALASAEASAAESRRHEAGAPATHEGAGEPSPEVGAIPTSLRGRPITELQKRTVTPLFPKLWSVSDLVYQEMTRSGEPGY
jgi:tryptophan 2,3-dioxygenase